MIKTHYITYNEDGLLPDKIRVELEIMEQRINRDRLEVDKININISTFRYELIKWLSEHRENS